MTTSGTTAFNPALSEIVLDAFNMCGIRSTSLLAEHMQSARMAANQLQASWSAKGINTWEVDLQTVNLVAGQATYSVPSNTIVMLEAYVTVGSGAGTFNRIITPVSRTEYASYSNPDRQGTVTTYWYNRQLAPTFSLYLVPDGSQPTLSYYRMKQIDDAVLANGTQVDVLYYWQEALSLGLAYRLAIRWAPDKVPVLKGLADEAYLTAAEQNEESGSVYVSPMVSSYYS